ncbi:RhoGAP-domain-containing protein [Thelephora terrestris]|uniref:RhoGAP-domain-containing protein n=1 Tax=Thelephora terrestris TaxID=56493 RepID=A0A9P6L884_9AGAM|nr:RhoGAP-domain-containing protein [Thelephora terrestris]
MPDEACVSPTWEHSADPNGLSPSGSNHISPNLLHTPPTSESTLPTTALSSPPPRSSSESVGRTPSSKWRESYGQSTLERRGTVTTITTNPETQNVAEPSFDENILRMLCDLDCSVPLLLDRIKQSAASCKESSAFFKKRAVLEDEYGRNLQKLARSTSELYGLSEGKAGSFVGAWQSGMKIHDIMGENRIRFAQKLNEMGDELSNLVKEVDKTRKQTKDLATRYERVLQESETSVEKIKARFDLTAEELERLLIQKEGESYKDTGVRSPGGIGGKRAIGKAVAKGGLLLKGRNPGNLQRQEDDIRSRMSNASDAYRKAVTETQAIRQEYFNFQLPRILRSLKECADEVDLGTQYHLSRYAFLSESVLLNDGSTLTPATPEEGPGLRAVIESIDNRGDFKTFMQNYAYAHGGQVRGPRREGPQDEGFLPPLPSHLERVHATHPGTNGVDKGRPTFGVDLGEQMSRDDVDVPPILVKCCEAIERYGIEAMGIYRISGTLVKVNKLKEKLDKDLNSVDLDADEWSGDINNVASVLKLWLRELPDPLMTYELHNGFLEAARNDNDRLRHIRLHERVNDLPDPNYATLKYLMGHLNKIAQYEEVNNMSISNLAIVFGPTLFGQQRGVQIDAALQNKARNLQSAVETILRHYADIFVDESEMA